mgnify:CR=1 FL=1
MRVGFVVQVLELGCRDMRVPLRGCDIAVPQQFLHNPYIRSPRDKHGGKTVPERVRRKLFIVRKQGGIPIDDVPYALCRKRPATAV